MTRCLLLVALCCFAFAMPARADLPPYGDWHPRLLVDADAVVGLPDSIAADPVKADAWAAMTSAAALFVGLPDSFNLGSNYGLTNLQMLSLVGLLADDPLGANCRAKVRSMANYLITNDSPWGTGDDLSAVLRLRGLLMAYDMAYEGASDPERQVVLDEIRQYVAVITSDFDYRRGIYNPYCSNHSITAGAVLGLASLGLAGEWPGDAMLASARSLGDSLIAKGVGDLMGADGSYGEGGLYMAYTYRHLIAYWEAALRLENQALWDESKVANAMLWVAYQLLPRGDGFFLNRNDCSEQSRPLSLHTTLWEWSQRRLADPRFARWVQEHISGTGGFNYSWSSDQSAIIFFHTPGEMLDPRAFLPNYHYFPDQGLYVHRVGWPGDLPEESFHFSFQAGTFYGGHWQEDVGQITLQAFTLRFAMDHGPGTTAVESEAHNLPFVDGLGQHNTGEGIGTDGTMQALLLDGFVHVLAADIQPAYSTHSPFNDPDYPVDGTDWSWGYDGGNPLERADRWVLLIPGGDGGLPQIYLLDDFRKDGQLHDYEWRLHFGYTLGLEVAGDHYEITGDSGRLDARLLNPPAEETNWQVNPFDNGGADEDSRILSVHHDDVDGRFLWQWLCLPTGEPEPPLAVDRFTGGLHAVIGEAPGMIRDLFYAADPLLLAPGILLAGRLALLETEGAQSRSALISGTEFRYQGRLYFGLQPAGTASVAADTVQISDPTLSFQIYAPGAAVVLAHGEPVNFEVNGEYIYSDDWTTAPPNAWAEGGRWRLAARRNPTRDLPGVLAIEGPGSASARLDLFDIRGRRLLCLYRGALPAGASEQPWAGKDGEGRRLPTGIYLARLDAGGQIASVKLLLLH